MADLNLTEEPTFELPVKIPRVGRPDAEVSFTFKHRDVDEFNALLADADAGKIDAMADHDAVLMLATGWAGVTGSDGKALEFNEANVRMFCRQYRGAAPAIVKAYFREFARARLGN